MHEPVCVCMCVCLCVCASVQNPGFKAHNPIKLSGFNSNSFPDQRKIINKNIALTSPSRFSWGAHHIVTLLNICCFTRTNARLQQNPGGSKGTPSVDLSCHLLSPRTETSNPPEMTFEHQYVVPAPPM